MLSIPFGVRRFIAAFFSFCEAVLSEIKKSGERRETRAAMNRRTP